MKFGFFTMPEHPPRENWTLSYDRDIANIVDAERLASTSSGWVSTTPAATRTCPCRST